MRPVGLGVLLYCAVLTAYGADPAVITITGEGGRHVVPEGQVWKIERLDPYVSERGVGTSDFHIQGGAQIGDNREFNLEGTFDLTLSGRQPVPLWLRPGSKIGVGDSRQTVDVQVLSTGAAAAGIPVEVASYVVERDLCEHFRAEPTEGDEPDQIERRKFLRQSVEIYCAGTDRRLAALMQRYRSDSDAMSLLQKYEPSSEGT